MNQGVTVDMRAINTISVNYITSVGPGALWDNIYNVLDVRNLPVVGGRVAGVGVGGLITGGFLPASRPARISVSAYKSYRGLSLFSPEKEFACDNVVNMEVVLASGQIVNVNHKSNPDLFAALKGGSNNFGVVTRFDLKSFRQKNLRGGTIMYSSSADEFQLQAFARFMEPANLDPFAENEHHFRTTAPQKPSKAWITCITLGL